jgi:hypothetical protein
VRILIIKKKKFDFKRPLGVPRGYGRWTVLKPLLMALPMAFAKPVRMLIGAVTTLVSALPIASSVLLIALPRLWKALPHCWATFVL